ncbi:MAG: DUF2163 domain-containing protein [Hoeflea sp.]|uniref:DUF2163 domain-containing protein n=1 Tax=Hoeflea sp. TaxID=1940281 RepID=UPI0032ECCC1F
MKTVSPAMAAHIRGDTTTLTTCWAITRQDGQKFFYTELDRDVQFEGEVYRSAAGFNKSAMKSSANFSIDEMEVTGFLRDDGITDEEMRNGAFDFALVEVFLVNYEDESMGRIRLRYGYFGEVRTTGSGAFLVELRGLVDLLGMKIGNTYLNECRQDVGDAKCGIIVTPPEHERGKAYTEGDRVLFPVTVTQESPRHYPDLLLQSSDEWLSDRWQGADLIMTPVKYDEALILRGEDDSSIRVFPTELELDSGDLAAETYNIRLTGKYFGYWEKSDGRVVISFQSFNGSVYPAIPGTTVEKNLPYTVPGRRWRNFSLETPIPPNTARITLQFNCDSNPSGDSTAVAYDDLDIVVVRNDNVPAGFAAFGGVEFLAKTSGNTAVDGTALDHTVGEETTDGTVTWEAIHPKYRFLSEVSETSLSATEVVVAAPLAGAPANWFNWGVLTFLSGENAGRSMEVMTFDTPNNTFKLALPLPYQPQVGDVFSVSVGCNKTATECANKFQNILNFRGHPRVPGAGQYFKVAGIG